MSKLEIPDTFIEGIKYVVQSGNMFYVKREHHKDNDGDEFFNIIWTLNPNKAMQFGSVSSVEDCINEIGEGKIFVLFPKDIKMNTYHVKITKHAVIEAEIDGINEEEVKQRVLEEVKNNYTWNDPDKVDFDIKIKKV